VQTLSENLKLFEFLFESSNDCILLIDKTGLVIDVNPGGCRQWGYTREEVIGQHITRFTSPEIAQKSSSSMAQLFRDGTIRMESAVRFKNGILTPIEINARVFHHNGEDMILSIHRNITSNTQIEKYIIEREARYRAVVETLDVGFFIVDMDGRIVEVNDAYVQRSGYSREELLCLNIRNIAPREHVQNMSERFQKIMESGHDRFESYHVTKEGQIWPVEVVVNYSRVENGRFFAFIHDITHKNKILSELNQSKQSMQKILDHAPIGMVIAWPDGRIIYANKSLCDMLGYVKEELETLTVRDVTYPDNLVSTPSNLKNIHSGAMERLSTEKRYIRKDGKIIWAHLTGSSHIDSSGETLVIAQLEDITEEKLTKEKLKESENKFRLMFENSRDYMIVVNMANGHIHDINPFTCSRLGYEREELIQAPLSHIISPNFLSGLRERTMKLKETNHDIFESEYVCKDKSLVPIEVNAYIIYIDGQELAFSISRDIAERKRAEKAMIDREALSRAVIERILDS